MNRSTPPTCARGRIPALRRGRRGSISGGPCPHSMPRTRRRPGSAAGRGGPTGPAAGTRPKRRGAHVQGGASARRGGACLGPRADRMPVRFPFDNTYARLPDRFFARLDPTPVAAPRLVRVNAGLAEQLGLDPDELAGPEGVRDPRRQPRARGRGADRARLCRAPVRQLRAAARRRPRHPARRGGRAGRRAARRPAQGLRADALLPRRRRPRRAGAGAARVHRERGDGGARRADDPLAGRGDDRASRCTARRRCPAPC